MGDEDTKHKHSAKRRRNFIAKRLRAEREYLPKIHESKPLKLPKINPRTVELEYLEDDN